MTTDFSDSTDAEKGEPPLPGPLLHKCVEEIQRQIQFLDSDSQAEACEPFIRAYRDKTFLGESRNKTLFCKTDLSEHRRVFQHGAFMSESKRIPTDGSTTFSHNPFAALSGEKLPPGPESPPADSAPSSQPAKKNRGRVDILRVKAGRGGKTVTVVKNFVGIGLPEKEQLAKAMQKACGTGGTVKNGQIEIQGDKREEAARILEQAGFRPVLAGG